MNTEKKGEEYWEEDNKYSTLITTTLDTYLDQEVEVVGVLK